MLLPLFTIRYTVKLIPGFTSLMFILRICTNSNTLPNEYDIFGDVLLFLIIFHIIPLFIDVNISIQIHAFYLRRVVVGKSNDNNLP